MKDSENAHLLLYLQFKPYTVTLELHTSFRMPRLLQNSTPTPEPHSYSRNPQVPQAYLTNISSQTSHSFGSFSSQRLLSMILSHLLNHRTYFLSNSVVQEYIWYYSNFWLVIIDEHNTQYIRVLLLL